MRLARRSVIGGSNRDSGSDVDEASASHCTVGALLGVSEVGRRVGRVKEAALRLGELPQIFDDDTRRLGRLEKVCDPIAGRGVTDGLPCTCRPPTISYPLS